MGKKKGKKQQLEAVFKPDEKMNQIPAKRGGSRPQGDRRRMTGHSGMGERISENSLQSEYLLLCLNGAEDIEIARGEFGMM